MTDQCFLTAQIALVVKKRNKGSTNKQRKTKGEKMKNGNNNTYHEPLSEEWIGRRY